MKCFDLTLMVFVLRGLNPFLCCAILFAATPAMAELSEKETMAYVYGYLYKSCQSWTAGSIPRSEFVKDASDAQEILGSSSWQQMISIFLNAKDDKEANLCGDTLRQVN